MWDKPAFETKSGKPAFIVSDDTKEIKNLKEKRNYIGEEKHIRITDIEIGKQIERIMELPEYESFNKVITESLFYGVPMLCEKLLGEVRLEDATPYSPPIKSNEIANDKI